VDLAATHSYDFDNLKKCPSLFDDGEEVIITEKIHGTFIQIGVVPTADANEKYYGGRVVISSKGMGAKGWILDHSDEGNLYAQAAAKHSLLDKMLEHSGELADATNKPVFLFGEVFGLTSSDAGIQDLRYTGERVDFRAFDMCVGNRGSEMFLTHEEFSLKCGEMNVPVVPVLYAGPYSKEVVLRHTDGSTTLPCIGSSGVKMTHIREGVVVKSRYETRNPHYGRKIAKSVSDAYLFRKGEQSEFA
jgi:RNA ligase (TIGR02306 family)